MLFNSYIFLFAFLPVTYLVFWLLRTAQQRYVWLAVTGYVFYGYWDPRFCLLMAFSTLVSYTAGLGFLKFDKDERRRKICLVLPIVVDLLLLGFFKYANFSLGVVRDTARLGGMELDVPVWNIILPVGISFYTFHTITYIVDCYRRDIRPTTNLFEFAAYVSLFSQLVAGPIVRFRQIEQDLEQLGTADRTRWLAIGVSFFLFGLVEKVLVADSLAGFVGPVFDEGVAVGTVDAWLGLLAYSFQLYFDFCGYSTMAVGLGYMFGLRIPQNFDSPYKAADPADFWRRWHISLSTCLRDYLYIPLGGSRGGSWMTYRNLMITMLLGGLWHGASWNFVIWGAYHGLLLSMHRVGASPWGRLPSGLRRAATFLAVIVGWVFFRSPTLESSLGMLHSLWTWQPSGGITRPEILLPLLCFSGGWAIFGPNAFDWHREFQWRPALAVAFSIVLGVCLAMIAGDRNSPFLYFQF